ncbi:hypothetical protein AC579_9615 [Pseudocercospora musae]|uniref:Uncharacterized protein n=1 Tax=Pseudocercospora musae TaxID=113226 RepID=A0A139IT75_9PEZI|nr:hypothetical protein AC579_9615 [Pseudocercospora musae]
MASGSRRLSIYFVHLKAAAFPHWCSDFTRFIDYLPRILLLSAYSQKHLTILLDLGDTDRLYAMSSFTAPKTADPRPSTDTSRTLIADSASIAPSEASTLRPASTPYRGFASEAAYLEALREWAESKRYIQPDSSLVGFYGDTTMETLASKPRMEFGISRRIKQRKASKDASAAEKKQSGSRSHWSLGLKKAPA